MPKVFNTLSPPKTERNGGRSTQRGSSNLNWFVFVCWHCAFLPTLYIAHVAAAAGVGPQQLRLSPLYLPSIAFFQWVAVAVASPAKLFNALGIFRELMGQPEWRLPAVNGSVYYLSVYAVAHFIFATSSEIKMLVFTLCKFFLKNDQKKGMKSNERPRIRNCSRSGVIL